jgi:hypothetical protein
MLEPTTPSDHNADPLPPADTPPPAAPLAVVVGTPEWDRVNGRRHELIRKDIYEGGLTDAERAEHDRLEAICGAALEKAFPAPAWVAQVAELEKRLAAKYGHTGQ